MTPDERVQRNRDAVHRHYLANRDAILERQKKWRDQNPDKVKACRARWKAAHPEKARAAQRRWHERHREEERANKLAYYYRRMAAMTEEEREAMRERKRAYYQANRERILARKAELERLRREPVPTPPPEPPDEPRKAGRPRKDIFEQRREATRRWRTEHSEEIKARLREAYHADPIPGRRINRKKGAPEQVKQAPEDPKPERPRGDIVERRLEAQRRYWDRHREELNKRKREARRLTAERRKVARDTKREVTEGRRVLGRLCTGCRHYLARPTCTADVFAVLSCGIRIAETCTAYAPKGLKVITPSTLATL